MYSPNNNKHSCVQFWRSIIYPIFQWGKTTWNTNIKEKYLSHNVSCVDFFCLIMSWDAHKLVLVFTSATCVCWPSVFVPPSPSSPLMKKGLFADFIMLRWRYLFLLFFCYFFANDCCGAYRSAMCVIAKALVTRTASPWSHISSPPSAIWRGVSLYRILFFKNWLMLSNGNGIVQIEVVSREGIFTSFSPF